MSDGRVTVTRTIDAPAEEVWAALTDPDRVEQWMMGARIETDWSEGADISWTGGDDGTSFEDHGKVVAAQPTDRLVYTHVSGPDEGEDDPDQTHLLTWNLRSLDGSRTELQLEQTGAASPEQEAQFAATWESMLDQLAGVATSR